MARLNLDYYEPSAEDVYTDGDIELELLEYAKSAKDDWYQDGRWPVVYHMSHLRHNILNWFPFKENCTILEIGAGCGALTGLLCERASKVVAVELTKRRANVNYERHKQHQNLEIVVCDFQRIPSEWKFDYVIVNGVLEYAAYMIQSNSPYEDFLRISAEHLNPNGRILLAIENRLGLKYFSGAKEDHTGKYFSGINGYVNGEKVRTFSKAELSEEIIKAKLHPIKFFYPYPDYKFPTEIFTDSTVCDMVPTVPNYPMDMSRTMLFEERHVYQSLMKNGVMEHFSNSFLVEIAGTPDEVPAEMAYVKISANRNENFRICTYFDEYRVKVHKQVLCPQAVKHLKKMKGFSAFDYADGWLKNNFGLEEREGHLSFPYIKGENLEESLLHTCRSGDIDAFYTQISQVRDAMFTNKSLQKQPDSEKFKEIFGETISLRQLRWANNSNVDMITGNIFIVDNSYQVIDYEWHIPCEVPQEFVMWRMLKQFVDDHDLASFFTKSMLYTLIDIDENTEKCFTDWENHFAEKYVGIKDLHNLSKDVVVVDVEQAEVQQMKERVLHSTLFYDLGSGFTDVDHEKCQADYSDIGFTATFTQEKLKNAKVLRWDPLEGNACIIKIQKIETDGSFIDYKAINAERFIENIGFEFFTFDPQMLLTGDFSNATYLKIYFSCKILDWTLGYHKREREIGLYLQENKDLASANQQLLTEVKEIQERANHTQEQFDAKSDQFISLSTEMTAIREEFSNIQKALYTAQKELLDTQKELLVMQDELQNTQKQLDATQNELLATQNQFHKTQTELQNTQNELLYTLNKHTDLMAQVKKHRVKTIIKVLLFGSITRGK
ncbi:methyltransferase domain-containing protein [Paenibacillus mesophilus]|uniref:class I SAM-dependent methyltransferase n=1 Tax=Paenibacillus mesophilus TaxID=2582849 RepID=UPI00110D877D|nr:class I SAM-dependent methyltransferase [Paenibacillus mesophilus]TMV50801.1 methyltransferase domain-containing protein [Paenibacillus mesophilus]